MNGHYVVPSNPVVLVTQLDQDLAIGDIVEIEKGAVNARYMVTRALPKGHNGNWAISMSMLNESSSESMHRHLAPHLEMVITQHITYVVESLRVCTLGPLASPLQTELLEMCVDYCDLMMS